MDCSPPRSSVNRILQARILKQLPCPPPGDLPDPGMELLCLLCHKNSYVSCVSCIGRWVFYHSHHLGSPFNDLQATVEFSCTHTHTHTPHLTVSAAFPLTHSGSDSLLVVSPLCQVQAQLKAFAPDVNSS